MVEITYQMFLSTLQTVGILVGIVYYVTIMRNAQRTRELALKAQEAAEKARQRELIIQRSQSYSLDYTKAYFDVRSMKDWKDAEEWYEKYASNPEVVSKWLYIMRLYTLAGLYLKEGADPDLLFELYPAEAVMNLWERFEPLIKYRREKGNNPRFFEPFEYLYNEAKKRYPDIIPSWQWQK